MIRKLFLLVFLISNFVNAQEERFVAPKDNGIEKEESEHHEREFTYGLQWATNGGILAGLSLKYSWQKKESTGNYYLIGLDLVHVEHHKEQSKRGFLGSYTFGKSNDLLVIRPHFGKEIILFNKAAEEGIQVSFISAAGPSIGFMKPYIIEYSIEDDNTFYPNIQEGFIDQNYIREAHFTAETANQINTNKIVGNAGVFSGFGSMVPYLGIHAKASLNFEYGIGNSVAGVEIGVMSETYFRTMPQMVYAENRNLFLSLFATLYYGLR